MEEKMQSGIHSIQLEGRTYHNAPPLNPTLINFFYGKNGAGKSTIAEFIKKRQGVTPDISQYEVLVYDKPFIDRNIKEDDNPEMPGVFSMNEGNIEKENEIKDKEKTLRTIVTSIQEKKDAIKELSKRPSALRSSLDETCWKLTADPRDGMPKAMKKKTRNKAGFVDELLAEKKPQEGRLEEIQALYDTAFGSDTDPYPLLKSVSLISLADMGNYDLLSTEIMSSADTPFAEFIRTIGSMDWMLQGHDRFAHKTDGKCPYCSKPLPDDFEEQVSSCLDKAYKEKKAKLSSFRTAYESVVDNIINVLNANKETTFPGLSFEEYDAKLEAITATINLNKRTLADKIAAPATVVTLEDIDTLLSEINAIITDFNTSIKASNDILAAKQDSQEDCITRVWQHMAFLVKGEIASYRESLKNVEDSTRKLKDEITQLNTDAETQNTEITALRRQIVNIDDTMESINKKLQLSGFQGFTLHKKVGSVNKYEILRDDGSPARNLSEGERNFIAFLYFYHKVLGRETPDEAIKDRIVVIDDPVSSMDSSSLFIVSSLVRELIGICFNNGKPERKKEDDTFIKQIFILTHNAFFHKEISYDKIRYFHCVNFYLIDKKNNNSTITCCTRKDPHAKEPAIEHNYTPVHNAYSSLWKEYKVAESPVVLRRIIKQILEYYFIQISGFDGQSLAERILKKEEVFLKNNPDGTKNNDMLHAVNALLHYVGSDQVGFNDGFNYVDGFEDIEQMRETFKCIFTALDQEQHFDMMMDTIM